MKDLEELIMTTEILCNRLSAMAANERKFGFELCHKFEMMSWDAWRSTNDLKELIDYHGVLS